MSADTRQIYTQQTCCIIVLQQKLFHEDMPPHTLRFDLVILCFLAALRYGEIGDAQLIEHDRVAEYKKRGHAWPPRDDEYTPNTPGWRETYQRRFNQIDCIDTGKSDTYQAYVTAIYSGLIAPAFTEKGWALIRAPQHLVDELKESLYAAMERGKIPIEEGSDLIPSENPLHMPLLHRDEDQQTLNNKVMHELTRLHEEWSGVTKLIPSTAYGLRIYRNHSNFLMHIDNPHTHVISSILHVDHDPNSEPWPLVIESFDGIAYEVLLESGDLLFYESSKCIHGRPRRFNGRYYTSLFLHYRPEGWNADEVQMSTHYRIPPTWRDETHRHPKCNRDGKDYLQMLESNFHEPNCEDAYCALNSSSVVSAESLNKIGKDEL